MIFVFNSTPLIYLCKAGLDWIFEELDADCIIPDSVYEEVVIRGKQVGRSDLKLLWNLNSGCLRDNRCLLLYRRHASPTSHP